MARLLLDAGVDPNDPQTLYNRQFEPDNDHLRLLFEYGLGGPLRGPWAERLGPTFPEAAEMLHDQLLFAAAYGFMERVELLVAHGVDVRRRGGGHPAHEGRSAYEIAVLNGNTEIAEYLAARGADRSHVGVVDELVGAFLRADDTAMDRLLTADPSLLDRALAEHPDVMTRAAETGRLDAVQLLVDLGIDVNDPERTQRITALHDAAASGRRDIVELLLVPAPIRTHGTGSSTPPRRRGRTTKGTRRSPGTSKRSSNDSEALYHSPLMGQAISVRNDLGSSTSAGPTTYHSRTRSPACRRCARPDVPSVR